MDLSNNYHWFYVFVCAAVGKVTTGFMQNLFQLQDLGLGNIESTILIFTICSLLLIIGKFKLLHQLIKVIGIVLLTYYNSFYLMSF